MTKSKIYGKFKAGLPRVDGKVFAITGTTSGTGYVAARTVAELGGEVLLLNRPSDRAVTALAKLRQEVPDGKFVSVPCDLQDFGSVRNAAEEIKSKYERLYCLANNAGIMATPDEATKDGFDTQMQTNHLSHFLLTAELFPLLEAEAEANGNARIVNHSSIGRLRTVNKKLEAEYLEKNGGSLGGNRDMGYMRGPAFWRYFQSKLANTVFTYALHEKLEAKNSKVRVICAHPGGSTTNLGTHVKKNWLTTLVFYIFKQSAEDGACGLMKSMMDPAAESGVLYGPKFISGNPIPIPPKPYENDPQAMKMLWDLSEVATGIKFEV